MARGRGRQQQLQRQRRASITILAPRQTPVVTLPPSLSTALTWPGFEVKEIPGKGNGVVATEPVAKYTALPYLGKLLTEKPSITSNKKEYVIGEGPFYDGNPKIETCPHTGVGGNGMFIAACVNEPSRGQVPANAWMVKANHRYWYVTTKSLDKGEELLAHYGNEFHGAAYKRIGYHVGALPRNRLPKWVARLLAVEAKARDLPY